jgi:mannonate dehydratase
VIPSFRWFGPADPIPLEHIRQIPGVRGIVSALYHIPIGEVWPYDDLARLAETIGDAGLSLEVIESIPVHEHIKLGAPDRERFIDAYSESLRNMGKVGVPVLCYNFMPIFDWMRTDLAMLLPDGSRALAYDDRALDGIDLSRGTGDLPGWAATHNADALGRLLAAYRAIDAEQLWENLAYFLERVVPVAAAAGVRMAIHPDDPPWPIFGLPRIITNAAALNRLTRLVDDPANGVTVCTGSLGADAANDLPGIIRDLGRRARVHFMHCRNVLRTGDRDFHEVPHPSGFGNIDMLAVMRVLRDVGFKGPMRPDHGRMIWGEMGRPGYGLYDRALGSMYLQGLWEAVSAGVPDALG